MYQQLNLDNQLCFRLYSASRMITQAYRPLLDPLGITYPQYLVMMVLWESDNITVSEICQRLMLDTNTLTPLLQRMEREGLLKRKQSDDDARRRIVTLTPQGRELEERAKEVPGCMVRTLLSGGLEPEKVGDLIPALNHIINALNKVKSE